MQRLIRGVCLLWQKQLNFTSIKCSTSITCRFWSPLSKLGFQKLEFRRVTCVPSLNIILFINHVTWTCQSLTKQPMIVTSIYVMFYIMSFFLYAYASIWPYFNLQEYMIMNIILLYSIWLSMIITFTKLSGIVINEIRYTSLSRNFITFKKPRC